MAKKKGVVLRVKPGSIRFTALTPSEIDLYEVLRSATRAIWKHWTPQEQKACFRALERIIQRRRLQRTPPEKLLDSVRNALQQASRFRKLEAGSWDYKSAASFLASKDTFSYEDLLKIFPISKRALYRSFKNGTLKKTGRYGRFTAKDVLDFAANSKKFFILADEYERQRKKFTYTDPREIVLKKK